MSAEPPSHSPEENLAFLRSIVDGAGRTRMAGGVAYMAGGLLYGLQCLFHWGQAEGLIRWPGWASLTFVVGITTTFLIVLIAAIRHDRDAGFRGSTANRALNATFGGAGLANLAMVVVFGVNAARLQSFQVWLLYPAVVFALQGAVWYVMHMLQRRAWMLATAIGWLFAAVALGLLNGTPYYLMVCTAALFGLMALPGWIMLREARAQAGA